MSISELVISIANKVKGIKDNVLASYDAIAVKGGEVPEEKSTENLPATISKLQVKKPEVPIRSVTFIDFDGTVLYSYSVKEYAQLTELPAGPTHWEHLNFIGWTHTLEETQNNREQIIGARYELKEPDKNYCVVKVIGYECTIIKQRYLETLYVDWGDGSAVEELSVITNQFLYTHTYDKNGEYEICVWGGRFYTNCELTYLFGDYVMSTALYHYDPTQIIYPNYTAKVLYKLSENLGTITNMFNVEWFVCTDKLTATNINVDTLYNLKGINLNDRVTSLNNNSSRTLKLIRHPNNDVLKLSCSAYSECYIDEFYVPNKVLSFNTNLANISFINKIHIQRSIIRDGSITTLTSLFYNDTYNKTFPTIYVPADSIEAYKTATNWSSYADFIFPEEE